MLEDAFIFFPSQQEHWVGAQKQNKNLKKPTQPKPTTTIIPKNSETRTPINKKKKYISQDPNPVDCLGEGSSQFVIFHSLFLAQL